MKLTIPRAILLAGLSDVINVTPSRSTLPILSNVLLEAKNGSLTITASDLDTSMRVQLGAEVEEVGTITLPAKKLQNIVRELDKSDVSLSLEGDQVTIKSGRAKFKLLGIPAEEFPASATITGGTEVVLDAAILGEGVNRALFAVSTDDSRYVLMGVNFDFDGSTLNLVGTDGKRMSIVGITLPNPMEKKSFILPTKAATELVKMLSEGEVSIVFSDSNAIFTTKDKSLCAKFIEGTFPNYRQAIPGDCDVPICVSREKFADAVTRVSLMESEGDKNIVLFIENGQIRFKGTGAAGEAEEIIPADYSGAPTSVAFNPAYLIAPTKHVKDDSLTFHLAKQQPAPLLMRVPFSYVLMPCMTPQTAA